MPDTSGRLRVVTLVDRLDSGLGGAERIARNIVTGLDPQRFDRTICVSRWSDERASEADTANTLEVLRQTGVRFLGLERRSARQVQAWRPLLSLLRRERVDVLHAHQHSSNAWAALLGTVARTPVVVAHEHSWSFVGQAVRRFVDREVIARRADAILTVSDEDKRRMIEIERIDPAKLIIVPNGIPSPPPPSGRDLRGELEIPPDAPVVGTVSVLRPEKSLDLLIRAAGRLRERFPELRVLIAGDGPQRARLQDLIDELGLHETVRLLGLRSDVPDLLRILQAAVCCSEFEGNPLSVMEYMEAGLPVVVTRVGGLPAMISDRVHGLQVERGDVEGLAAALGELLENPGFAAELGRRGQERRRTEFDLNAMIRRVERVYLDLYEAAGSNAGRGSASRP